MALAWQQQPKKYVILDDKQGGFKVYDVESYQLDFVPDGDISFDAKGQPVRGFSKEQGLVFSANRIIATAERTTGGSLRIKNGQLTGKVVVDVGSTIGDETTKSHLESESVTMAEEANQTRITLPSAFMFSNHVVSSTADRLMTLRAPSGTFVLPPLDQPSGSGNPFKSADVKGPITITLDSKRKSESGTSRHQVEMRGDRMRYDGAQRVLVLEGNVQYDVVMTPTKGEPVSFGGEGSQVRVEFNEDSTVKQVTGGGGGTVTLRSGGGQ